MWPVDASYYMEESQKEHVVTYLGGLYPQKGFHVLAAAWKRVLSKIPDAKLYVVGSRKLYTKMASVSDYGLASAEYEGEFMPHLTDEDGNILRGVKFFGVLGTEKNEIIKQTAVGVCNPSGLTETFCISAAEFSAAKVAVVTCRTVGNLGTVIDEETGLIVSDDSDEELADAIIRLLKDEELREKMGRAGRAHVENNYSPEKVLPKWEQILDDME